MRIDQSAIAHHVDRVELHEPKKMKSGGWSRVLSLDTGTGKFTITLMSQHADSLKVVSVLNKGGGKTV